MIKHIKNPITRTILVLLLITVVALGAIAYARGYRIAKDESGRNIVSGTGLLVLTSSPDGARAFIDGELTSATNDTLNLKPDTYEVRIEKDGYFPWEKEIRIRNEQVTETNALLFPKAPQLTNLTTTGVSNPVTDPEKQTIAYTVASSSADTNGIYAMNLNRGFFPIGDAKRQIASNLIDNFSSADLEVSPDGSQILATIDPVSTGSARTYMLDMSEFNPSPLLVTNRADEIKNEWEIQEEEILQEKIRSMPSRSRNLANNYFEDPLFSAEENKILYTASESARLPLAIDPPIPSTNSTPETRNIEEGSLYVYNIKDDKNYLLREDSEGEFPEYIWHPDNRHLYFIENNRIHSIEYDGHNQTTVYAGPFMNDFVIPWPDGTGIVILTSFNDSSIPPNLYRVVFK